MVWSRHQPSLPLAPISASAARQRHPEPEHTPILSLSLPHSLTHTRAQTTLPSTHTHAAGIPARLCRAHDISMFYAVSNSCQLAPARSPVCTNARGRTRGRARAASRPDTGRFLATPRRANMTSTSQRARRRIWLPPPQAVFILSSAPIGTSTPAFFKSDLNPKYVISALLSTPILMLTTVIRNKTLLVSTNKVVVSATVGLKATGGIQYPVPTDPFTLFPTQSGDRGPGSRFLFFGFFFSSFSFLLVCLFEV